MKRFALVVSIMLAGLAFASSTRSSLASRGASLSDAPEMPTVASYIQDGLVAIWDGIENINYGEHDSEATKWKDLVSGINIVPSTLEMNFLDDHVHVSGANNTKGGAKADKQCLPTPCNEYTIEIVYRWSTLPFNDGNILLILNSVGNYITGFPFMRIQARNYLRWSITNVLTSQDYIAAGANVARYSALTKDANGVSTYKANGILSLRTNRDFNVATADNRLSLLTGDVDYYAIRLYSRCLTDEEIAHNHSIDKERFNLP